MRIVISTDKISLKCEFINDIDFHVGEIAPSEIFHRTDSWQNILSNKICAINRNEEKDMADLLYLSSKFRFSWQQVIDHARKKDLWVNELDISKYFSDFDLDRLHKIKWIAQPDYMLMEKIKSRASENIIKGAENNPVINS